MTKQQTDISNQKTLLLTGGSSGIGMATADYFAQRGWTVYEMSRHGADRPGVVHLTGDVTIPEDCHRVVNEVIRLSGHIDVLISNAGMGIAGAAEFAPVADVHRQIEVNFYGASNIIQATIPYMRRRQYGRILIVSSLAATFSIPFQAYYSASKAALNALAMSLRNELAPHNIGVACLMPGDVHTAFTSSRLKTAAGADVYPRMQSSLATMERDEQQGQSAQGIAQRLYGMATTHWLRAYYYVGPVYHIFALLSKLLPASLIYSIVRRMY